MPDSLVQSALRPLPSGVAPVGPLGFGCWRLTTSSVGQATELIETALGLGMNLIDTADVYGLDYGGSGFGGNEAMLGQVLAARPDLRSEMVLATKGGIVPSMPYDSSDQYLRSAVEASLRRLNVDVIDLYQIHRPDLFAHPGRVADTLTALVREGKVRTVGISNYTPAQHQALVAHLEIPLATTQPHYSAAHLAPLRDGTFDLCLRDGVVPLAWSPLAGGRLITGEQVPEALLGVLDELAERESVDRAAVAYAFVLAHPAAPVALLGTQDPGRLHAAADALRVHLDRTDLYRIVEASEGVPLP